MLWDKEIVIFVLDFVYFLGEGLRELGLEG